LLGGLFLIGAGTIAFGAEEKAQEQEAMPPKNQHYVGKNTCAACHYSQYRIWKLDKHAIAFDILPKKYRKDPKCLVCHTTGYGEPTGYKDESTPQLAGTTCETCHGPGSEHAKLAQKLFLGAETDITLEAEQRIRDSIELFLEKDTQESRKAVIQARSSIFRIRPGNACVKCHTSKAHKAHMEYDKE
jgi:hypothetical protein